MLLSRSRKKISIEAYTSHSLGILEKVAYNEILLIYIIKELSCTSKPGRILPAAKSYNIYKAGAEEGKMDCFADKKPETQNYRK